MSLTRLTTNLNNLSSLADQPTEAASELKAVFDKAGNDIKSYINNTLLPEIEENFISSSGGTINNNLYLTKSLSVGEDLTVTKRMNVGKLATFQGGLVVNSEGTACGIECYGDTPYIDFHRSNSSQDYTHRIIAASNDNLKFTSGISCDSNVLAYKFAMRNAGAEIKDDINGNVFIRTGARSPIYCRSITGDTDYVSVVASAFTQASSRRYKENIRDITMTEANKIDDVKIRVFDYINGAKNQVGVIAEELVNVLPNLVTMSKNEETGEEQCEAVNYAGFTPYLLLKSQNYEERLTRMEQLLEKMM